MWHMWRVRRLQEAFRLSPVFTEAALELVCMRDSPPGIFFFLVFAEGMERVFTQHRRDAAVVTSWSRSSFGSLLASGLSCETSGFLV